MTAYDPKRPRRRPEPAPVDALIDLSAPKAHVAQVAEVAVSSAPVEADPSAAASSPAVQALPSMKVAEALQAVPSVAAVPTAEPGNGRAAEPPLTSVRAVPAVDGPDEMLSGRTRVVMAVGGAAAVVAVVAVLVVRRRTR